MYAALIAAAFAQDEPEVRFEPYLQVRPRAVLDYTEGLSKGFLSTARNIERSRLGLAMRRGRTEVFVGAQQYRTWTSDGVGGYTLVPPQFEVYAAYGRYDAVLPGNLSLRMTLGRQLVDVHEGRIVSAYDFSPRSQPLDGGHFRLSLAKFHADVLTFRDFSSPSELVPRSVVAWAGWSAQNPVRAWTADVLVVSDDRDGWRQLAGLYGSYLDGPLRLGIEGYVQQNAVTDEVATTGLFSVRGGWIFGDESLLLLEARYDHVGPGWEPIAPNAWEYQGHMGLFQRPEDTDDRGVRDLMVRARIHPQPRLTFGLDVHQFWLDRGGRPLGAEADLTARVVFNPAVVMEGGIMVFAAEPGFSEITDLGPLLRTGYLQLEFGLPRKPPPRPKRPSE